MRMVSYARTPPEAPGGLVVFVVHLLFEVMARAYAGDFSWGQRGSDQNGRQPG